MQNDAVLYKQAVDFYQNGNLADAERILRQVLSLNPHHGHSLNMMAIIALDVQRYDIAEELSQAAVTAQNSNPAFYFTLARILNRQDKKEDAVLNYRKAISLKPDYMDALNNLGTTLMSLELTDEAAEIFARILEKNPQDFNALSNTASILFNKDEYEQALEYYSRALTTNPKSPNVHNDIGRSLKYLSRHEEALLSFEKAIEYKPDYVEALLSAGKIYRENVQLDKALNYYSRIRLIVDQEEAYANVVHIYWELGRYSEAIMEAEEALKKFPESVINLNALGNVYSTISKYEEALSCFERAFSLEPDNVETLSYIGATLKNLGRLEESINVQKKALGPSASAPWIYGNLLLTMVYASFVSPEELTAVSREFGEKITDPLMRDRPFKNDKALNRKLKIGYISPDFREHAVSYFLSPIYKLDKEKFETFAYARVPKEDDFTIKIRKEFDHWRDIKFLNDDAAADLIESDKIDILVDIAGHTAHNGLMVFARKPAPIQVTWLGHPATTGMKAMDYRITDSYAEPPGMTEDLNIETLWRMPDIFCSYSSHANSPPVIDHPPFEDNGYITFGCFNNFTKVNDAVLSAWAKIMNMVPDSRLLLEISGIKNEKTLAGVERRIAEQGIDLERVILEPRTQANQFVLYNKIDIALDPFPCNGGTTSMDTLWMGVPFVTLSGRHFVSRMGVSILTNVGMPELIAESIDEYVSIAVNLAQDKEKLRHMRHNLRERTAASPLMDQDRFARNMGDSYRQMWKKWVESQPA